MSGAPGIGIGETRNDGFRLKYAINRIKNPNRKRIIPANSRAEDAISRAPWGLTAKRSSRPNWSPTKRRALKTIFCLRKVGLRCPAL
jgi:hypothetical protein